MRQKNLKPLGGLNYEKLPPLRPTSSHEIDYFPTNSLVVSKRPTMPTPGARGVHLKTQTTETFCKQQRLFPAPNDDDSHQASQSARHFRPARQTEVARQLLDTSASTYIHSDFDIN